MDFATRVVYLEGTFQLTTRPLDGDLAGLDVNGDALRHVDVLCREYRLHGALQRPWAIDE